MALAVIPVVLLIAGCQPIACAANSTNALLAFEWDVCPLLEPSSELESRL